MGFWGDGPLQNDLALDVSDRFQELVGMGLTKAHARAVVLVEMVDLPLDSPEDRIVRAALDAVDH